MNSEIRMISVHHILHNPFQTRKGIDLAYIDVLADDIKANGLLEYPAGRVIDDRGVPAKSPVIWDEYLNPRVQLAYGHNRLEAYKYLAETDKQYEHIPVRILSYTDEQMALTAWSENEIRKQFNPVERARAIAQFIDKFGWTQSQVAEKIRLERSTVANMLRLLRMPDVVLSNVAEGILSQRQAMALLPFYELPNERISAMMNNPNIAEFVELARNGMFDSDTIRDKMSTYIERFRSTGYPDLFSSQQAEVVEAVPECAATTTESETPGEQQTSSEPDEDIFTQTEDESGAEQADEITTEEVLPVDTPLQPEPPSDEQQSVCAQTPPVPTVVPPSLAKSGQSPDEGTTRKTNAPEAAKPAPQSQVEEKPNNDLKFSVTWFETGVVFVGLQLGNGAPVMRMLTSLEHADIPVILAELQQQLNERK